MLSWFLANWVNAALIAAVLAVIALILWGMIRDRRAGRSACGCSCSGCGGACAGCSLQGACFENKKK